jgi:hypothetical protein
VRGFVEGLVTGLGRYELSGHHTACGAFGIGRDLIGGVPATNAWRTARAKQRITHPAGNCEYSSTIRTVRDISHRAPRWLRGCWLAGVRLARCRAYESLSLSAS